MLSRDGLSLLFFCFFMAGTVFLRAGNSYLMHSEIVGFIENKGQVTDQCYQATPDVKYLLSLKGFNVQLRTGGFSYDTYSDEKIERKRISRMEFPAKDTFPQEVMRHYHRIDIDLLKCNPNPEIVTAQRSSAYLNYFTTGTVEGGVSNVHYYGKVIYKNIYPGIDLEFCSLSTSDTNGINGPGFEYNFIVHPGGKISDIQLSYKGAIKTWLKSNVISIQLASGVLTEHIPFSFLEVSKKRIEIKYLSKGNNIYSFYCPLKIPLTSDLIIDPAPSLSWGTYYGGALYDEADQMAVDGSNNVYIAGHTSSTTAIATSGVYQTSLAGSTDAFIAKINSTGTSLIWGTYYGGTGYDSPKDLKIDGSGNVYISGFTASTAGIATAGAYQTTNGGSDDGFIAKFNSTGTSLTWATYYGGTGADAINALALDGSNNLYFAGNTASTTTIATAGAYQTVNGGAGDAFVAKINSTGTTRLFGTYYGGTGTDIAYGISLDGSGNIYIAGPTGSSAAIATAGAYQTTYGGGTYDIFIAEFNTTCSSLTWGSYYGGEAQDYMPKHAMVMDASNNIYISGYTVSTTGISTSGAYQTAFAGTNDVFVAKINSTGTALAWGTYYGGTDNDIAYSIAIDIGHNVYLAGRTVSTSGIATAGSFQTVFGGTVDGYIAIIKADGASLSWGTYYGGASGDYCNGIAVNASGDIFISGVANSSSAIATAGSYQSGYNAGGDAFVAKFNSTIFAPIELLSFTGKNNVNGIQLYWSTATETNNDFFTIKRSGNGKNFETIGYLKGAGNSSRMLSYSFLDEDPFAGINYYQLKQTDYDGEYSCSTICAVDLRSDLSFNIFPNPTTVSDRIYLNLKGADYGEPVLVLVYDQIGNEVLSKIIVLEKHYGQVVAIDTFNALSPGIYMILAASDNAIYKQKLIINRN